MDLADLYAEKKEDESKGKDEGGRRLNVIAESDSRKAVKVYRKKRWNMPSRKICRTS